MIVIRPRNYRPPAGSVEPKSIEEGGQADLPSADRKKSGVSPPPQAQPVMDESWKAPPASETADEPMFASEPPLGVLPVAHTDSEERLGPVALVETLQETLGNRFEILDRIAIGGMATLFQLRHRVLGGLYVIKVLHAHLAGRPALVEAFQREAVHVARLSAHPGVVPVFDLVEVHGVGCMIMPYIEGEDLDQLLARRGKLERDEALLLAAQVASLLMYAETQGIAHGDLATGNIRLDRFGQYRVLDFGLSRSVAQNHREKMPVAGTPAYNSPEQLRGDPPDICSDLYSLGVILAEVLTGAPVFAANTLEEMAEKHRCGDWTLAPELEQDVPLCALLQRLIVADREQRMQSAFELSGALAAFGFELPSFQRSLGGGPLQPPKPRRRRLEAL